MTTGVRFVDLADAFDDWAFRGFVAIYDASFPAGDHREDPELWRQQLQGLVDRSFRFHLIVAISGDDVVGGVVFEYYPDSKCGLITYLVVAESARRKSIGQQCLKLAEAKLGQYPGLRGIFGEVASPGAALDQSLDPFDKLEALHALGFRQLEFAYIQPRLSPRQERARDLFLVVLACPGPTPRIPKETVIRFVQEFFEATEEPFATGPDYEAMMASIRDEPGHHVSARSLPLRARPVLSMPDAAIAYHIVRDSSSPEALGACDVLDSFELDLLSHRYQGERPSRSRCVWEAPKQMEVVLPEQVTYVSEGRTEVRSFSKCRLHVNVFLASTEYPEAGVTVDHLILRPREGEEFTEYDLLRLAKVSPGLQERVDLSKAVQFQSDGQSWTFEGLSKKEGIFNGRGTFKISGLTMDVVVEPRAVKSGEWDALVANLVWARNGDGQALRDIECRFSPDDPEFWAWISALSGLATGIFDFGRMDRKEIVDTLMPAVPGGDWVCLSREHLVEFDQELGVTDAVATQIGMSPYLLLVHSILLCNEHLLRNAEKKIDNLEPPGPNKGSPRSSSWNTRRLGGDRKFGRLRALESYLESFRQASALLRDGMMPNIFHYKTERRLFEAGMAELGIDEGVKQGLGRLELIQQRLAIGDSVQRRRIELLLTILILLLTFLQAYPLIKAAVESWGGEYASWAVFIVVAVVFAAGGYFAWQKTKPSLDIDQRHVSK